MITFRRAIASATLAAALTACGAPGETSADAGRAAAATAVDVDVVDFGFEPDAVTVPPGTTVVWTHTGASRHTVDFADGTKSGDLEAGATYRRTFDEPGAHPYICFYHPAMTGTVEVSGP